MPVHPNAFTKVPAWSWLAPCLAGALLAVLGLELLSATSPLVVAATALLLAASVFSSVHHAEVIAARVGEPFGSIVLAIAVTVIEVALIVSVMVSAKVGGDTLARDTVYATVMIVLNGVVGLCVLSGGARHYVQSFETNAAVAALSVLGTLSVITLVLPNYTLASAGPVYSSAQLVFVSIVSIVLYCVFLFVQTIRHRDYFLSEVGAPFAGGESAHAVPPAHVAWLSVFLLCVALAAVVLLAKVLSPSLERGIAAVGLPKAFIGVVIAGIVLLPEGIAAVGAARRNQLQTSLNLALGSAMATIGLTIPIVGVATLLLGQRLTLGLGAAEMVLLLLTLFISTVTLATGRTTILQGSVHLVIFAIFLFIAAVP